MSAKVVADKNLLAKLNEEQAQAVTLSWGPALVVAGAGSGKTTVLTRRIAHLIRTLNQDPESILAVTFTNKAAGEMKARVEDLLDFEIGRRLSIGTFHSVCARILRREIEAFVTDEGFRWSPNFVIYDETDSLNLVKNAIARLDLDDKVFVPKNIKHDISSLKNDGFTCSMYQGIARTHREERIARIFANYQGDLARNNALDFDDLILVFTELLNKNRQVLQRQRARFKHLLVDEFQDTNKAQYDLVKLLSGPTADPLYPTPDYDWNERSLMVVGDVDQSIYSWRKADFRIILGFQKDYKNATLIKLEENYRSTATILEIANSIIVNNSERIEKVLRCNRSKGSKAQYYEAQDEIDEAYYVVEELKRLQARGRTLSDAVILYRTNSQSRAVEEVLVRNHLPYIVVGSTRFYERQEIKDILAYLKLIYNEKDGQAFNRVINSPKRGLGKTTLARVSAHAEAAGISALEAAAVAHQIKEISPKAAKGLSDFAALVKRWQEAKAVVPVSDLLQLVLKDIQYIEKLEEDASSLKDELASGRIENVKELVAVAQEFESLADEPDLDSFLTRISLVSDLDQVKLGDDAVKLMTLHSAKGLEYPVVFLMGLEDGLFPHARSLDSPSALEEERRLMYVGVTRAADLLYLTRSRKRVFLNRSSAGPAFSSTYTIPSRFLKEIQAGLLSGYYPQPETAGYDGEDDSYANRSDSGAGAARNSSFNEGRPSAFQSGGMRSETNSSKARANSAQPPRAMRPGTTPGEGRFTGSSPAGERFNRSDRSGRSQDYLSAPASADNSFQHLKVGDLVQHAKFGSGVVVQVIGEKDKELYNVEFDSEGKRLLDPRFAKLIKLP